MNVYLGLSLVLSLILGCSCTENKRLLEDLKVSEEDSCAFAFCETPNWKQDKCCEGYVCIMPTMYDPVQRPRCTNKRFLPGFGYNFGYEILGLDSPEDPS